MDHAGSGRRKDHTGRRRGQNHSWGRGGMDHARGGRRKDHSRRRGRQNHSGNRTGEDHAGRGMELSGRRVWKEHALGKTVRRLRGRNVVHNVVNHMVDYDGGGRAGGSGGGFHGLREVDAFGGKVGEVRRRNSSGLKSMRTAGSEGSKIKPGFRRPIAHQIKVVAAGESTGATPGRGPSGPESRGSFGGRRGRKPRSLPHWKDADGPSSDRPSRVPLTQ